MLALVMLLGGCTLPPVTGEETTAQNGPQATVAPHLSVNHHQEAVYEYKTDVNEAVLCTGLLREYLLLANKTVPVGQDYVPDNLVVLKDALLTEWHRGDGVQLNSRAAAALYEMMEEMRADGVDDVLVTSAYRSFGYQKNLYQTYLSKEQSTISSDAYRVLGAEYINANYLGQGLTGLSRADAERVVLSYSAYPGTSEHQTGLCVDFITSTMGGSLTAEFEATAAYAWLSANAYRFGFILRYSKEKEAITGYTYEPWHYRFVGREAATDMHFGELTLEEYLGV